jgi:DNA-binding GntR family transcriptional regulator
MEPLEQEMTITDRAVVAIRRAILAGEFRTGQLYAVNAVATQLGVSRTPAREALIRLAADGMISFERNRGFVVKPTTATDLVEIFVLRLMLEVPATSAAARSATAEQIATLDDRLDDMRAELKHGDAEGFLAADRSFHTALLTIGGNARLADIVDGLRNFVLASGVSTANRSRPLDELLKPHVEIRDAVADHQAELAAGAMRDHILQTGRLLLDQEFDAGMVRAFEGAVAELAPEEPMAGFERDPATGAG